MIEDIDQFVEVHQSGVETMQKRITDLEAENKRLREAAREVVKARGIHRHYKLVIAIDKLNAALEGE